MRVREDNYREARGVSEGSEAIICKLNNLFPLITHLLNTLLYEFSSHLQIATMF